MRVQIESLDALQEIESIRLGIDLDGSRRPIRHFRRPKAIPVGHGDTQVAKQCPGKSAKALLSRNPAFSMVMEFCFLRRQDFMTGNAVPIADVMMRAHEECMARIVEKPTNRRQFTLAGMLAGALRIEADDDEHVDAIEKIAVQKRWPAIGGTALNNAHDIA